LMELGEDSGEDDEDGESDDDEDEDGESDDDEDEDEDEDASALELDVNDTANLHKYDDEMARIDASLTGLDTKEREIDQNEAANALHHQYYYGPTGMDNDANGVPLPATDFDGTADDETGGSMNSYSSASDGNDNLAEGGDSENDLAEAGDEQSDASSDDSQDENSEESNDELSDEHLMAQTVVSGDHVSYAAGTAHKKYVYHCNLCWAANGKGKSFPSATGSLPKISSMAPVRGARGPPGPPGPPGMPARHPGMLPPHLSMGGGQQRMPYGYKFGGFSGAPAGPQYLHQAQMAAATKAAQQQGKAMGKGPPVTGPATKVPNMWGVATNPVIAR